MERRNNVMVTYFMNFFYIIFFSGMSVLVILGVLFIIYMAYSVWRSER